MRARSSAGHVELLLPRVADLDASATRALRFLEARTDERSCAVFEDGDALAVRVSLAAWRAFGQVPAPDASPEETDLWVATHEHLARLRGIRGQAVTVDTTGFVGGARCTFHLRVDGGADAAVSPGPVLEDRDATTVLLPAVYVAALAVHAQSPTSSREAQLALLGALREQLDTAAQLLAGSAAPLALTYSDHLRDFAFTRRARAALAWRPSKGGGKLLNLEVDLVAPDGTREPLDIGTLDPAAPIVSVSAKEHILVTEDVAAVARLAKERRNQLPKRVAHLLADPKELLPPGSAFEGLDLSEYSPRVLGFAPILRAERFADIRVSGVDWYERDNDPSAPYLRISIAEPDGGESTLAFKTREDVAAAAQALEDAASRNEPVALDGKAVAPTEALRACLRQHLALDREPAAAGGEDEQAGEPPDPGPTRTKGSAGVAAVIKDANAATAEPAGAAIDESAVPWSILEAALRDGIQLKDYQRRGIAWLWHHYQAARPGALLADDMGLGKTLQVAAFLALQAAAGREEDRQRPVVVVTPLILITNWEDELRKCFRASAFQHIVALTSERMRELAGAGLLEAALGGRKAYALIPYDTLARYQKELLRIDWACAVLDEAQHVKNPDTFRTSAVRGLKRSFGICATGTPVENRLLDVWTLFDFLSPGRPFGAKKEFSRQFEDANDGVDALRRALSYPSPTSPVLRREKREALRDLPPLDYRDHPIPMTLHQMELERRIVRGRTNALEILGDLQKLYQHPQLLASKGERVNLSPARALEESPKLARCVEILREIQARHEKAIVFTLWTTMQDLLADVLRAELGLDRVHIVNGASNQGARSRRYIDEFQNRDGFDVIILSPLAAGTGLTITAANHVIHYGRWWNPAKEDQATGRAHRIGQTLEVHVHYPILHHPGDERRGFDLRLHELVGKKRAMARDFLAPLGAGDVSAEEVASIFAEASPS